jgi:hypothetical protein
MIDFQQEVARGGPTAADFLRLFRMDVGTDQVTYDATVGQTPSKRTIGFDLPRVGLASRVLISFEANFTAVEAGNNGQPAKSGLAPYSAAQRLQVKIGGSGSLIDVTGVGAHLMSECDGSVASSAFQAQPWPTPDDPAYDVQHRVYAWDEATTPPRVTGVARWGYVLPFSLHYGQPLGMILLGTDRTLARVEVTMADLSAWVAGAGFAVPAASKVTITVRVAYEFFEVPTESAYATYVQPLLRYAHRITEDRQDIVAVGPNANIVQLLPYDAILQIAQYFILDGKLNVAAIDGARLRLNRSVVRDELVAPVMWREQREQLGRDVPALVWHYFERASLRSAIRAGDYTDLRTELDIATGTTIAAGDFVSTITRKIVDLGAVAG